MAEFNKDASIVGHAADGPTDYGIAEIEPPWRLIAEATNDGIWDWNLISGASFWTDRLFALLGLAPGAIQPGFAALIDRLHPDDRAGFDRFQQKLLSGDASHVEIRLRQPDAGFRYYSMHGKAMLDEAGRPARATGSLANVTARRLAENALRESEQRHRALVSVLTSIVWRTDPHGSFVVPQDSWQEYTGQSWEQHAGRGWLEAIHPEDRQRVLKLWADAVEQKQIYESDGRLWHAASGKYRYFQARGVPMIRRDGSVREWVGVIRDIDDRRRAENELRASEERLRQHVELLNLAHDAILVWGRERKITFWNQGAVAMYGYPAEEALGKHVRELLQTEYPAPFAQIDEEVRRLGRWQGELIHTRKDGARIIVESRWGMLCDAEGNLLGMMEVNRDISDRKRADIKLREAADYQVQERQWLESLLNLLPVPMLLIDPISAKVSFSNQAAKLGDAPFTFTAGNESGEYFSDGDGNRMSQADTPVTRASRGERLRGFEMEWHKSDGTRSLMVNAESLPAMHGHERVAVLLYQDITKQKGIEADLRRANQAKDALLAMLGHELRNPLAAITGAAELIELLDPADANFAQAREVLHAHIYQLVRLVDDMLDVSRLTRGKIRIRREPIDLRDVLAGALQTCQSAIEDRRHTLIVRTGDEALTVEGDSARLEQVFANLLLNAAKYTDEGGQITVIAEQTDGEVIVRIRDNGIGISSELLPLVFDLFRQLNPSPHRAEGGLGIGLNVAKNLVELHGGSVAAYSEGAGRGSEFVVCLPRSTRPLVAQAPLAGDGASDSHPAAILKVLIVEDNPDIAHSMLTLIRHLGHTVELAHEGCAALALAKQLVPDVAFVDIGLPGMTGLDLAQAFRRDDDLRSIHLIALTGFGQAEDRRRSKEAGFDEHLVKPLNFARLQELLAGVARQQAVAVE